MARVMTSYAVLWHGNARYLVGLVDGVVTKTSSLVLLDEKRHVAATRSGSIYAIEEPTDDPPAIQAVGVAEIPLETHGFCRVHGTLHLFGRAPGGRAYAACPQSIDTQASLCVASDGRMFRLLNPADPCAALHVLAALQPKTTVADVELYDDCPAGLETDALWANDEGEAGTRTVHLSA